MKSLFYILLIVVCQSHYSAAENNKSYKIIVNKMNPTISIHAKDVSKIFLRKTKHWNNGKPIIPIDLPFKSKVREIFTTEIHKRNLATIRRYWQQRLFAGRGRPPEIFSTDDEVVDFVKANRDAIGYVSAKANITEVKVLKIVK